MTDQPADPDSLTKPMRSFSHADLNTIRTPEEMTRALRGELAIITGASSGIGAAIARDLCQLGMRVALIARRRSRLVELSEELKLRGGEAWAYPVDLRDTEALERTLSDIQRERGSVRVLINNAGLGHSAPLTAGATEQWREMLEVNVLALCVCTREATSQMRQSGDWGQVLHISSMSAHRVPKGSGVYSATKFAVRSLTEGLRRELRELNSLIRVSALSPGFVETEFAAHYHRSEERAHEIYSAYPVLSPLDVARQARFILTQPPHIQVHDLLSRPTLQES